MLATMSLLADLGLALTGASAAASVIAPQGSDLGKGERRLQQRAAETSLELARKGFYEPLQTRVKDAKAAGIHPLFALGYQGSLGMPTVDFYPDSKVDRFEQAGRFGRALAQVGERRADRMADAQVRSAEALATKSEAEAVSATADAVLHTQPGLGPAAPLGAVAGVTRPAQEPVEPTRDWKEQLMRSKGDVHIEDIEDKVASDLAERVRDSVRIMKGTQPSVSAARRKICKENPEACKRGDRMRRKQMLEKYRRAIRGMPRGVGY